jgi:hypothetical protein|tara:strand:+ start:2190 stop:2480 length:291 start_codon:yes stop_codon:yes gene_type:complete
MTYTQVLTSLSTLSENELRCLNSAVIDQLKAIRDLQAAQNRRLFKAGDKVSWNGRNGYTEGVIVRVKRKKAIVDVIGSGAFGSSWDVPLNMLTASV